jgi:hypothetical protein
MWRAVMRIGGLLGPQQSGSCALTPVIMIHVNANNPKNVLLTTALTFNLNVNQLITD